MARLPQTLCISLNSQGHETISEVGEHRLRQKKISSGTNGLQKVGEAANEDATVGMCGTCLRPFKGRASLVVHLSLNRTLRPVFHVRILYTTVHNQCSHVL